MKEKIYGYVRADTEERRAAESKAIRAIYPQAILLPDESGRGLFDTLFYRAIRDDGCTICAVSLAEIESDEKKLKYLLSYVFEHDMALTFVREPYFSFDAYFTARTYVGEIDISRQTTQNAAWGEAQYMRRIIREQYAAYIKSHAKGANKTYKKRGIAKGTKLVTRKSQEAKPYIRERSKTFGGYLTNQQLMAELGITETTLLKYKREIRQEQENPAG